MQILVSILIFSAIVLFHEFGHFLFAKLNGIKVLEFCLGLGPTVVGKKIGETYYSIKALPFGGACMMAGEDSDEYGEDTFNNKSVLARISVVFAGPFFNFILAFILSIFVIYAGGYDAPIIKNVLVNSPAYDAGLRDGDEILKINDRNIYLVRDFNLFNFMNKDNTLPVNIKYKRNNEVFKATIEPRYIEKYSLGISYDNTGIPKILSFADDSPLKDYAKEGDYIIEINNTKLEKGTDLVNYLNKTPLTNKVVNLKLQRNDKIIDVNVLPKFSGKFLSYGFDMIDYRLPAKSFNLIKYSFLEVRYFVVSTIDSLKMIVTGKVSTNDVSGPVGIVNYIGNTYNESKKQGTVVLNMMFITILLSSNLGVMNLLPIPALDGGRLVFLLLELIFRKPVINQKVEAIMNTISFYLLLGFIFFITFKDILKLF